MSRALLISALCFWASCPLAEAACEVTQHTTIAYYTNPNTNNVERCKIQFGSCNGDCYNSYEHHPHQVNEYNPANENCEWYIRTCRDLQVEIVAKSLYDCVPVSGGGTPTDHGWTELVTNVLSCHCSTAETGEGASDCPLDFL